MKCQGKRPSGLACQRNVPGSKTHCKWHEGQMTADVAPEKHLRQGPVQGPGVWVICPRDHWAGTVPNRREGPRAWLYRGSKERASCVCGHAVKVNPSTPPPRQFQRGRYGQKVVVPKLVRDGIPAIMEHFGDKGTFRALQGSELQRALLEKLVEEAMESNEGPCIEEFADVQEALDACIKAHGFTKAQLAAAQVLKRAERGGFDQGLQMVDFEWGPKEAVDGQT